MTVSQRAEPGLHKHTEHKETHTLSIQQGIQGLGETGTAHTTAQNRPRHCRTSLLVELRTRVFGEGRGRVTQFRFSKDFTLTVQHSVFGSVKGLLQEEEVREETAQNSFDLS